MLSVLIIFSNIYASYHCEERRSPDRYTNKVSIVMTCGYRDDCLHNFVSSSLLKWHSIPLYYSKCLILILRLIIYTGKGGTGKTVTACSTAIKMAENNHNTLIISADPAHTLGDAFMMPDVGYEPKMVLSNLH